MSNISFDVFTLQLKLDVNNPPYRTITIPSFYTFDKLQSIISWLFMFSDEHDHIFKVLRYRDECMKQEKYDSEYDADSSSALIQQSSAKNAYYYLVADKNERSFLSNSSHIKYKSECHTMLQSHFHHQNDSIIYQYDFDSNINSNWTIIITLLSIKSIKDLAICDFDPFEFVEVIDGNGRTIPEYDKLSYDENIIENEESAFEQELREYDAKRLNEELQIMRKEYTMFMRRNKKRKQKESVIDIIHDDDEDVIGNDAQMISLTETETDSNSDFVYTTESDVLRHEQRNDYDHIIMYKNKKKHEQNRKRATYFMCCCIFILFVILFASFS